MLYSKFAEACGLLEKTPSKLKKTDIVAGLFRETSTDDLPMLATMVQGKLWPAWYEEEAGIADKTMLKVLASMGYSEKEAGDELKKTGDLGLVAEKFAGRKKQSTLFSQKLTVKKVFENLRMLASVEGHGSQERKQKIISELLHNAGPAEAKYIVRQAMQDMRIGVAEGIARDAIVIAFLAKEGKELKEMKEETGAVEWAWFLRPDYGEVALIAKKEGLKGLKDAKLKLGEPIQPLLAEKAGSLEEALTSFENPVLEFKYDGARIAVHKKGDRVWLYTRRLENVTKQFPDIVELVRKNIKAENCLIEGEALAVNRETGKPVPFQVLSQRVHRKYDIEEISGKIPVQVNLFDIVYLDGEQLFDKPMRERRSLLEGVVKAVPGKFQLAKQLVTKDLKEAGRFYREALAANQEGVMVKNLDAPYQPGRRVAGGWLKVKPIMETLDLVITGAVWGTGKRAGWFGSFMLSCRDAETGGFLECGMLGTGIKEKKETENDITFTELTKTLKPHVLSETRDIIRIRPKIVIEVAYEEIQRSPNYSSGFALRFPRMIRVRYDKSMNEADSKERIKALFSIQKGGR
jgi:DNA ligase-1